MSLFSVDSIKKNSIICDNMWVYQNFLLVMMLSLIENTDTDQSLSLENVKEHKQAQQN